MHRFVRFVTLALIILVTLLLIPLVSTMAQGTTSTPPVYILVVDDFGGNMRRLVNRVTQLDTYRNVLTPIITQARDAGRQTYGSGRILSNLRRDELPTPVPTSAAGSTATPIPPIRPIRVSNLRAQAARAGLMINNILRTENFVTGNRTLDQDNCTIIPEGESAFTTGGASAFTTGGASAFTTGGASGFTTGGAGGFTTGGAGFSTQPHGVRVQALLNELLTQHGNGANIIIQPIDIEGFSTSVILDRIQTAIGQIAVRSPGASIVINMSFAVVPCTSLGTLAAYDAMMSQLDPSIAGDMAALQSFFDEMTASGVYTAQPSTNDPLSSFIRSNCDANQRRCQYANVNTIIPVAASGNDAAHYPYYPAAWSSVVAVSASADAEAFVSNSALAAYSNWGGVMMPGTWVTATGSVEIGTSFAAPRYSFLMAMGLAGASNDVCNSGSALVPALPNIWGLNPPTIPANVNHPICG
ncbi:MAG: hypothetical protein U0670_17885 [Anaerolineae bacterium]